jgi:transcriptional regulator with XRE-family HTH domain
MPRPNKARTVLAETYLAQRLAQERERRGMSYEGLAERMTAAGCAIQASALFKVEKGKPPRRVTVDELVALSEVLGIPMNELVSDPSKQWSARAWELHELMNIQFAAFAEAQAMADKANAEAQRFVLEYNDVVTEHPEIVDELNVMFGDRESYQARFDALRNTMAQALDQGKSRATARSLGRSKGGK